VLAAWGFTAEGKKVLLALMAGSKEDAEMVSAFFQDMRSRGLGDPLLVASDGAPGIVKAIETCFPRTARQRCLAHRMRNLTAKLPEDRWPDFKARATAAYQAPSRAIARDLAEGIVADYDKQLPGAVASFMDDFEACITHLRVPATHRRAIRTTNLLERLFLEERRRLKIIPNAFGEKAVLKLMFAAMTRAAERWRAVKITDFERRQMAAVRAELDSIKNTRPTSASQNCPQTRSAPSNYPAGLRLDQSQSAPCTSFRQAGDIVGRQGPERRTINLAVTHGFPATNGEATDNPH
jgi:transposase-like protein